MRKVKLVESLFVIVLSFVVIFTLTQISSVLAVDDENVFDFGNEDYQRIEATNTTNNSSAGNTTNNTVSNNTTNNVTNNTTIGNIANNSSTNLSNRNVSNTNGLADTGLSTTGGTIALIVVIGIISIVYSYKKVNDYKNL